MAETVIETWKDIPGYEGFYEASDIGRIRNLRTGLVLKQYERNRGVIYLSVTLYREGEKQEHDVHRLISLTFLGPCPKGKETRHGVGRNKCNKLWNLSYGTLLENVRDKARDGTQTTRNNNRSKFRRVRRSDGKEYANPREAARDIGKQYFCIWKVCEGKRKTAYGYGWSYCETETLDSELTAQNSASAAC